MTGSTASGGRTSASPSVGIDTLFAVGAEGFIAFWDGRQWRELSAPERYPLSAVFVVSEHEVYACSQDAGRLLQGSVHGWTELLRAGEELACVAKWQGDVWVGSLGDLGLCKLSGNRQLVSVAPDLRALSMDARRSLLLTTLDAAVATQDGVTFAESEAWSFAELVRDEDPSWI